MLRKLLIAVLVLGLIFCLSSTAFSTDQIKDDGSLRHRTAPVVNTVEKGNTFPVWPTLPVLNRLDEPTQEFSHNAFNQIPKHLCEYPYSFDDAGAWYSTTRRGDQLNQLGTRFDMTEFENHTTVVYGAIPYLYYVNNVTGTGSLNVFVYEDLGGVPGALLYTENYDMDILVSGDYNYLPFTTPVAVNGTSFYITMACGVSTDADTVVMGINQNADGGDLGTGVYYVPGTDTWYTLTDAFGGFNLNFDMYADACTEYSSCDYFDGLEGGTGATSNWLLPDPDWAPIPGVLDGFGMNFNSEGGDSIKVVTLQYLYPDVFGDPYDNTTSTNGYIVSIWGDDAGDVDVASGPLAQVVVPGGWANIYPDWTGTTYWQYLEVDFSSFNLVLTGPWHVTVQTSDPDPAAGQMRFALNSTSDFDGVGMSLNFHEIGVDPDENWHRSTLSSFWQNTYVVDRAYLIYVDYCKDEFYECDYEVLYAGDFQSAWALYGANIQAAAQHAAGSNTGNRISYARFQVADDAAFGGPAGDNGDPIVRFSVFAEDATGLPGAEVWGQDFTYTTGLVNWPGWTEVVIPDVIVNGNFWVGYTVTNQDDFNYVYTCMDLGGPLVEAINGGGYVYYAPYAEWINSNLFGGIDQNNFIIEVDYCGIPASEATCDPGNDNGWVTYQGDMARTGASNLALGDAWCKLNLNWNYQDGSGLPISLASPIIYNDKVVITIGDANNFGKITVLNIADGTLDYFLTNTLGDGQLLGKDMRCTPMIVNMDIGGVPTDVMFIAGGTTNGIGAVDFATGALLWQRTVLSVGVSGLFGQTRYSTFMALDQGGTMVVYVATDAGNVVALEAETGAVYAGWAVNPVDINYAPLLSGTTDGVNLFYTNYTTATEGDIYAIDAATGDISWTLSGSGGLQAANVFVAYATPEGFRSAVSYDSETNQLFVCSYANLDVGGSDHPTDGVMYFIDASTGGLNSFLASGRCLYATPTVDKNVVFVPTYTKWAEPPAEGNLLCYNKAVGTLKYATTGISAGRYNMSGIRTCEPAGVDDLFVVFNEDGMLEFWNSVTGELIFTRRVDHGPTYGANVGLGGAMAKDSNGDAHLVFVDVSGGVYDMTLGDTDRQRAAFYSYRILSSADFGPNVSYPVDFGPLFYNNGCADLTVTSVASDASSFGGRILGFAAKQTDDDVAFRANNIADEMTLEAVKGMIGENTRTFEANVTEGKYSNSNASANPLWLNGVIAPVAGDVLAPGDEANLILDVNQPELTRGVLQAFVQIGTDDPDFFLNEGMDVNDKKAEILVTLIGGCLLDTTTIHFGIGGANSAWVTNTMMLGDGDWTPPFYTIDGDNGSYYQGALGYATSKYQVAINVSDWWSNTEDQYVSIQADPVWCATDECSPTLVTGVSVGAITTDGLTYTPITADYVCKTFIDSVQNFDRNADPLVTDWQWYDGAGTIAQYMPFDDTLTIGLTCNSRLFGVQDVEGLDNFVFEIFDFQNRNAQEVNNWAMGHMFDPDGEYVYAGTGGDASYVDRTNSICWTAPLGYDGAAMFTIKVPFGCGELDGVDDDWDFQPVWNAWGFTGLFNPMDGYLDTMHYAMTNYIGIISNDGVDLDDSKGAYTLARHNFEENGTYSLGLAYGQFVDLTQNTNATDMAPTAHLINKWAGFGRGDVNNDNAINLGDIIYLASTLNGGPGAIPFAHLSDVNADGAINQADLDYMIQYYFYCGPCPLGDWMF